MGVNVYEWLGEIKKLDELIDAKIAERDRIREMAVSTNANISGMPHTPGVSDKVGALVCKLVDIETELNDMIDKYIRLKADINAALEKLPPKHYGVMHRYYIQRMKNEAIAAEMHYSTVQIWRIKKEAAKMLKDVIVCNVDMKL